MNEQIFYFFYNLSNKSPVFDTLVIFIANPFSYLVILAGIMFLFYHHEILPSRNPIFELIKKWREIFFVFLTWTSAWFVASVLKLLIATERPVNALPHIFPLFEKSGFAFPSGHATVFSALATSIYIRHKKIGILFFVAAVLIGVARVISGVHFPIDILGGFAIGITIAYLLKNI